MSEAPTWQHRAEEDALTDERDTDRDDPLAALAELRECIAIADRERLRLERDLAEARGLVRSVMATVYSHYSEAAMTARTRARAGMLRWDGEADICFAESGERAAGGE